jgi:hypothetical protein
VDFVDYVDLVRARDGGIFDLFDYVAHVLDAVVGCRVHFKDVQFPTRALVHGRSEDFGDGRFARAARPAKKVRVCHPFAFDLVDKCLGDMLLPDDLVKCFGAVCSVKGFYFHGVSILEIDPKRKQVTKNNKAQQDFKKGVEFFGKRQGRKRADYYVPKPQKKAQPHCPKNLVEDKVHYLNIFLKEKFFDIWFEYFIAFIVPVICRVPSLMSSCSTERLVPVIMM